MKVPLSRPSAAGRFPARHPGNRPRPRRGYLPGSFQSVQGLKGNRSGIGSRGSDMGCQRGRMLALLAVVAPMACSEPSASREGLYWSAMGSSGNELMIKNDRFSDWAVITEQAPHAVWVPLSRLPEALNGRCILIGTDGHAKEGSGEYRNGVLIRLFDMDECKSFAHLVPPNRPSLGSYRNNRPEYLLGVSITGRPKFEMWWTDSGRRREIVFDSLGTARMSGWYDFDQPVDEWTLWAADGSTVVSGFIGSRIDFDSLRGDVRELFVQSGGVLTRSVVETYRKQECAWLR
jgi:hypothetical protein